MDQQAPNYHREFLKSPQHAALGLLTLGAGFMSGMILPLIAGATIYTLGWIYLPDLPFFAWAAGTKTSFHAKVRG